jgi:hypothetical protein
VKSAIFNPKAKCENLSTSTDPVRSVADAPRRGAFDMKEERVHLLSEIPWWGWALAFFTASISVLFYSAMEAADSQQFGGD